MINFFLFSNVVVRTDLLLKMEREENAEVNPHFRVAQSLSLWWQKASAKLLMHNAVSFGTKVSECMIL